MRENDRQLGKPLRAYVKDQAVIEALALGAIDEGCIGYASDIDAIGAFDGAAWSWLTLPPAPGTAVTGGGQATWLAYWTGASTLSGDAGLTYTNDKLTIVASGANDPVIQIEGTSAGTTAPTLDFYKNSATPADGDDLGAVDFFGKDSGGIRTRYAYILAESLDITNGDEAGVLVFEVKMDNVDRNLLELSGYNGAVNEGEVIINQEGQDVDFRVEAVGAANAVFVRGSDGLTGINESVPGGRLQVTTGGAAIFGLLVEGAAGQTSDLQRWTDNAGVWGLAVAANGDLKTDRWVGHKSNTIIGIDAAGTDRLAHGAGAEGYYNTAVGNEALYLISTGGSCTAFGWRALRGNSTGKQNAAFGASALVTNSTGGGNMGFGTQALRYNTIGHFNVGIGTSSVHYNEEGDRNIGIGYQAGFGVSKSNYSFNVFIGYQAGRNITTGDSNILIGHQAGYSIGAASNKLYIESSNITTPLIYGEFDNDLVKLYAATALTNAVHNLFYLSHVTSGTAVAGYGVGLNFELEENDGTNKVAAFITADWQDAGEGASADGRLNFGVMTADAAAATAMSIWNGKVGLGTLLPATILELEETVTLAGDVADDYAAALTLDPAYTGAHTVTRHNYIDVQDVSLAGGAAVTNAAVLRFNNTIGNHSALAAAFQTTDSGADTTNWAGGIIVNINGTLYKVPLIAV